MKTIPNIKTVGALSSILHPEKWSRVKNVPNIMVGLLQAIPTGKDKTKREGENER